ncbi:ROK family protein [Lactobacillus halodurans]|uniref:ROK family protein n=1 Tax=Companilactobacillus halodurans TaxID=2584183 RepID=A0A5P0ZN77_9LACO|nr:ROK family protein [Companilactobacillus halodurans]MQS97812.1 ROK family protein [Companilactobacillus halodurans]
MKKYLVFDIGGTAIKFGLIDHSGKLIEKNSVKTPQNYYDFVNLVQSILDRYNNKIRGIAFSVPGRIDHDKDMIFGGGSLPFLDKKSFNNMFEVSVPISVENDGKSAALSELWLGNLKNINNGASIVLGTGVGSGIIMNHHLVYGANYQAGEISFMLNDNANITYNSLEGSLGSAVKMVNEIAEKLNLPDKNDGIKVFNEINNDNKLALRVFKRYCHNIALLIHNIQSVLDLDRYTIGGGISAQKIVTETINSEFDNIRNSLPIIKTTLKRPEIVESKFKNDANLYGALYYWLLKADNVNQLQKDII